MKEKEKHREEKLKEKEKMKEEKEKTKEKVKERPREEKPKEKSKENKELKHKEFFKDAPVGRQKKKKDQTKGNERKKSVSAAAEEEEPVFGVPLPLAVERSKCHDGVQLPAVVRQCIDYIEQHGLNCEGIYRLSGVKSKVQQLKRAYNQRDSVCLYDHEPHTVASLLKLFLRELPEPVLTAELLPLFDAAAGLKDPERRVQQLTELLERLPAPHRLLLQYMFKHMEHIIKREKVNKMNVQNVSLVLSPTMQISHRVLNAFFLYGKILFSGVIIKRYVPPIADGDLPDTAAAIQEEIEKQESLLSQLHGQLKSGSITQRREEQLWEAQRILTQLKRRQRFVTKRTEAEPATRSGEPDTAPDDGAPTAAAAAPAQRLERTVQIINEDNVTVIQIGEKSAAVGGDERPTAGSDSDPHPAPAGTQPQPEPEPEPEREPEPEGSRRASCASLPAQSRQRPEPAPQPEPDEPAPAGNCLPEPDEPAPPGTCLPPPGTCLPPPGEQSQASFSDLHRRVAASAAGPPESLTAVSAEPAELVPELVPELVRQLVLLRLEEDELESSGRELRSRLAAERTEIGRLRDTIREMETLYKYRTYSVDSSDDSSADASDDSDSEEELVGQLRHVIELNQQLQVKNAQLVSDIHEQRRLCQRRRAEIRYLELQQSAAA
ncbi:ralA-binding protein 1-like [Amphibalanus amphitrite]|uniref:ralA-binding protein 1-like n=1 Tax=Amphibalanus amphitrite TaxID=1232801 RepID=UPI001C9131E9|nr:ralA-binding protein 1-like [Amphibalanus amphitrite]